MVHVAEQGDDRGPGNELLGPVLGQGLQQHVLGRLRFSEDYLDLVGHADELDQLVEQWTKQRSAEEVMEILQKAGVAAGVVQNAQDLVDKDPHLQALGFWKRAHDPVFGETTFEGVPARLSETPGQVQRGAPLFGEHNDYVFGTLLGMLQEEIQQYTEEGIFKGVPAPR